MSPQKDSCGLCGCNQPGVPHALTGRTLEVLDLVRATSEEEGLRQMLENALKSEADGNGHPFGPFSAGVTEEINKARKEKVKLLKGFMDIYQFERNEVKARNQGS